MKIVRVLNVLLAMIVVMACILFGTLAYFAFSRRSVVGVTGAYMEPALKIGDCLVLQKVSGSDIVAENETGDILVFYYPGNALREISVSRAVEKHLSGDVWVFKMKYDISIEPSPWILDETDIIGRVVDVNSISVYFYILLIPLGIVLAVLVVFWVILYYLKRISPTSSIGRSYRS